MFEKNKIKKLFDINVKLDQFNLDNGANTKIKLKSFKKLLKELDNKHILERPNALENIINYYFQKEIYNLIIKFFEFKIDVKLFWNIFIFYGRFINI